jgi:hypothetical protein
MRLIDADALIEKYGDWYTEEGSEEGYIGTIKGLVDEQPTIEPEQKKGKWIYGEESGQDGWCCSECGGFIPWYYSFYGLNNIDFIKDFKTCPFCDSKMVSLWSGYEKEGEQE